MTLELIYFHQQRVPFQGFLLFLADQRVISVDNPEFLTFAEDGRSLSIFDPSGSVELIDRP